MADIIVTTREVRPLPGAVIRELDAGGAGNVGDVVYINASGQAVAADADAVATAVGIGIVVSAGSMGKTSFASGDRLAVVVYGPLNGYSGMTPGARVFASGTVGRVADAAPATTVINAVAWVLGLALDAATVFVAPLLVRPQAAITNPAGGATIDAESRTAITAIILALEEQGILARNG